MSQCCNQASCCAANSKLNAKDARMVTCIQPQCGNSFHSKCIGWSAKSATEFSNDVQVFLCDACLKYINAITAHIVAEVKSELLNNFTQLKNKVDNLETKLLNEVQNLETRITALESNYAIIKPVKDDIDKLNIIERQKMNENEKLVKDVQKLETAFKEINEKTINFVKCTNSDYKMSQSNDAKQQDIYLKQIRISGIAEEKNCTNFLDRKVREEAAVKNIFSFIGLADLHIDDMHRIGKFDKDNNLNRPLKVTLTSVWDKRKLVASASKLKNFSVPVYITSVLSPSEQTTQNALLKYRRNLINEGVDRSRLKIKGLQLFKDNVEVPVSM